VSDLHDELAALSAEFRRHLERERGKGRRHLFSPALKEAVARPAPRPRRADTGAAASAAAPQGEAPAAARPAQASGAGRHAAPPRPAPSPVSPVGSGAARPVMAGAHAVPAANRGKKLPRIEPEPATPDRDERMAELSGLAAEAAGCTKCGLSKTRHSVVFSRGRAGNRVMFVGEAPGANEDAQGLPFVGRAGKLLDQIIDAIGFDRDEIYVANILKCRPPGNRDPKPEEIATCTPYLETQIELIQPKIICALGRFAAGFLTGNPGAPMGRLRGKIHYYRDRIMVLPTYHPAALLRNPNLKRVVWEDVQLLRKEYLR
jgi:uracil-DNA glycosylase family 4